MSYYCLWGYGDLDYKIRLTSFGELQVDLSGQDHFQNFETLKRSSLPYWLELEHGCDRSLYGQKITRRRAPDGAVLRRVEEADGSVWWDVVSVPVEELEAAHG